MSIFAIADLHLAFSAPDKSMEFFGKGWHGYSQKIEEEWRKAVQENDLVLIPGDISWARNVHSALVDLMWIDRLPGTKLLLKGNHDSWWYSLTQVRKILPPSLHVLQNDAFLWENTAIGGCRLWDTDEYEFEGYIDYVENPRAKQMESDQNPEESERIFVRELGRLEMSLKQMHKEAPLKIAMTHYPPIGPLMTPTRASRLLDRYGIQVCVFGHLHSIKKDLPLFGRAGEIEYKLVAADYLDFKPLQIV